MAGRGGHPGHEYKPFHSSPVRPASSCNNRGALITCHWEITKVPGRSIAWTASPGHVTFKAGGNVPVTHGNLCKFLSTPWPQGATRATKHICGAFSSQGHIQVAVCPCSRLSGAGKRIFPSFLMPGFGKAPLICACIGIGAAVWWSRASSGAGPRSDSSHLESKDSL